LEISRGLSCREFDAIGFVEINQRSQLDGEIGWKLLGFSSGWIIPPDENTVCVCDEVPVDSQAISSSSASSRALSTSLDVVRLTVTLRRSVTVCFLAGKARPTTLSIEAQKWMSRTADGDHRGRWPGRWIQMNWKRRSEFPNRGINSDQHMHRCRGRDRLWHLEIRANRY